MISRFLISIITIVSLGISPLLGKPSETKDFQYFQHGVASGDPLEDRLIIWTRITLPTDSEKAVEVKYYLSEDSAFKAIIKEGDTLTDKSQDFTVKIDLNGLEAGKIYYYRFSTDEYYSPIGRSRTAPAGETEHLRFAVMSCSNYEDGYFHAYRHAAQQENIQAVIHLGDYIYESFYHHRRKTRDHFPATYIQELEQYRHRYAQYRTDTNLQEIHRLHPFISVWDDHEVSNDAFKDGTAYGGENIKDWSIRLAHAKQAYFEWMPIREQADQKIYRKISFGNLVDLFMLDTRFEGRDQQFFDNTHPEIAKEGRSMLGKEQLTWLQENMKASKAKWRVLGNQVIFSPIYARHIHRRVEDRLLDIWDGYPAERLRITKFLKEENIQNTLIVTGDFHSAFALDVPVDDWNYPRTPNGPDYNMETGENAVAVEFVVPSITSQNFDEFVLYAIPIRFMGTLGGKYLEGRFKKEKKRDKTTPNKRRIINPHIMWTNLRWHGYILLDITPEKTATTFHMLKKPWKKKSRVKVERHFEVLSGENHLKKD